MLLRNYDNLMLVRMTPPPNLSYKDIVSTDKDIFGDGHINAKTTGGSIVQLSADYMYWRYNPFQNFVESVSNNAYSTYAASSLICGGGDTAVTYDDYKLDVPFTTTQMSDVTGSQKLTRTYNEDDNSWTFTYCRTLFAKTDLTIKEIGIITQSYPQYDKSNSTQIHLIYRKVLETPVEVPANANFVLSFTMTVSANPNKPADYNASATLVE